MRISRSAEFVLGAISSAVLVAVYLPLLIVLLNSFNTSVNMAWPPPGFTLEWWQRAFGSSGLMAALGTSVLIALCASLIAMVLGTLLALALSRYKFFGKSSVGIGKLFQHRPCFQIHFGR